MMTIAV
jgi:hypothetical protein